MGKKSFSLLFVGSFVLVLHWQCSSCQQESTGYRLGGQQRPTDNITVLVSDSSSRKDDEASIMGPFVHHRQESRPAHQWKPLVLDGGDAEEEEEPGMRRVRRDDDSSSSSSSNHNSKGRPAGQDDHHKDNSRLLVQTLNGLVRGTTKTALGDTVDVFLGVRNT